MADQQGMGGAMQAPMAGGGMQRMGQNAPMPSMNAGLMQQQGMQAAAPMGQQQAMSMPSSFGQVALEQPQYAGGGQPAGMPMQQGMAPMQRMPSAGGLQAMPPNRAMMRPTGPMGGMPMRQAQPGMAGPMRQALALGGGLQPMKPPQQEAMQGLRALGG